MLIFHGTDVKRGDLFNAFLSCYSASSSFFFWKVSLIFVKIKIKKRTDKGERETIDLQTDRFITLQNMINRNKRIYVIAIILNGSFQTRPALYWWCTAKKKEVVDSSSWILHEGNGFVNTFVANRKWLLEDAIWIRGPWGEMEKTEESPTRTSNRTDCNE